MKAYSIDLRQRIVEAYLSKEESVRSCAQRFKVSRSFVQKLIKMHQHRGEVSPLPHGGGFPAKLADHTDLVKQLLTEKNDATLEELCQLLKERIGIEVSQSSLCRLLQRLNLTRKKNFSRRTSRN
jgi:transposase